MDYQSHVGKVFAPYQMQVDEDRIAAYCTAIGAGDPAESDGRAVAPLTYGFTILIECGQLFNVIDEMGVEREATVHGAQGFDYHAPICAGDTISGQQTIERVTEKRGGALVFIDVDNTLRNQTGALVARLTTTIVIRNG